MTGQRKAHDTGTGSRKWMPRGSWVALFMFVVFVVAECSLSAFVAAVLLALSIALDYFVMREQRSDSRLGNELAVCEYGKALLLAFYLILGSRYVAREWVAPAAFIASAAAFVFANVTTATMIWTAAALIRRRPAGTKRRAPIDSDSLAELQSDKVLALTGVLIAFLHVTYFFSFALAFSDHFVTRGLWAQKRVDTNDENHAGPARPAVVSDGRVHKFFFVESATTLACTTEVRLLADQNESLRKRLCGGELASRFDALRTLPLPACDHPKDPLQRVATAWNIRELYELRDVLHHMEDGASYLVEVRGHANDTRIRSDPRAAYSSNYEISKQRADQVTLVLNTLFRDVRNGMNEPAVRWLAYGVANEDSQLDPDPADWLNAAPLQPKLSVEVHIQPVADSFQERYLRAAQNELAAARVAPRDDLELIDYIYFTTYTITTTGYGDIIPVGNYTKLIVTLANLIELLFVVVLVNVVANPGTEREP